MSVPPAPWDVSSAAGLLSPAAVEAANRSRLLSSARVERAKKSPGFPGASHESV
jgi:hypothetical protein